MKKVGLHGLLCLSSWQIMVCGILNGVWVGINLSDYIETTGSYEMM